MNTVKLCLSLVALMMFTTVRGAGRLTHLGINGELRTHILMKEKSNVFRQFLRRHKPDKVFDADNYQEFWSTVDNVLTLDSIKLLKKGRWICLDKKQLQQELVPLVKHGNIQAKWFSDTILCVRGKLLVGDGVHSTTAYEQHDRLLVRKGRVEKTIRNTNRMDFMGMDFQEWVKEVQRRFPKEKYESMDDKRLVCSVRNIVWKPRTGLIDKCELTILRPQRISDRERAMIKDDILKVMKSVPMKTFLIDGKLRGEMNNFGFLVPLH